MEKQHFLKMSKRNKWFKNAENEHLMRDSDMFEDVEMCCESDLVCSPFTININGELYAQIPSPCGTIEEISVLQNGIPVGELIGGDWIVDPCPVECVLCDVVQENSADAVIECIDGEDIPLALSTIILRPESTPDLIVESVLNAGKGDEVSDLICEPVEILDQDDNVIAEIGHGGTYNVIVFSGIKDSGPPYTNSIITS